MLRASSRYKGETMASGDSLYVWTAHADEPPSTNFAEFNTRNGHFLLEFSDTVAQAAIFRGVMARNYAGGGVTVRLGWMAASETLRDALGNPIITPLTAGSVKWNGQFERHQAATDDLDTDSFAAAQTTTAAAPATAGTLAYSDIAFTNGAQMDSIAVGEGFRLNVTRDAADVADTMAGVAQLVTVELRET